MPALRKVWLPTWWTNESSATRAPKPASRARSVKSSSSKLPKPKRSSRPPMASTTVAADEQAEADEPARPPRCGRRCARRARQRTRRGRRGPYSTSSSCCGPPTRFEVGPTRAVSGWRSSDVAADARASRASPRCRCSAGRSESPRASARPWLFPAAKPRFSELRTTRTLPCVARPALEQRRGLGARAVVDEDQLVPLGRVPLDRGETARGQLGLVADEDDDRGQVGVGLRRGLGAHERVERPGGGARSRGCSAIVGAAGGLERRTRASSSRSARTIASASAGASATSSSTPPPPSRGHALGADRRRDDRAARRRATRRPCP